MAARPPTGVPKRPGGPPPAGRGPIAKVPAGQKRPVDAKGSQAPLPAAAKPKVAKVAPPRPPPPAKAASTTPAPAPPQGDESWREFTGTDPLYALLGEVQQHKVFGPDGQLRPAILQRYLEILLVKKAAKKPKDWVQVWAAMEIPVESQAQVLQPILSFGREHAPEGLGLVLAELLKGHRIKPKPIEEAVQSTFRDGDDETGILRDFLFVIFPKGPSSDWGWSRVGWSWQEWWRLVEQTLGALAPSSAFDQLAALLDRIEGEGGTPLVKQPHIWNEKRLTQVRGKLCTFGGVEKEDDLVACLDATLK